jgi:hypothetical protein
MTTSSTRKGEGRAQIGSRHAAGNRNALVVYLV